MAFLSVERLSAVFTTRGTFLDGCQIQCGAKVLHSKSSHLETAYYGVSSVLVGSICSSESLDLSEWLDRKYDYGGSI